jgi:hypothetical protein
MVVVGGGPGGVEYAAELILTSSLFFIWHFVFYYHQFMEGPPRKFGLIRLAPPPLRVNATELQSFQTVPCFSNPKSTILRFVGSIPQILVVVLKDNKSDGRADGQHTLIRNEGQDGHCKLKRLVCLFFVTNNRLGMRKKICTVKMLPGRQDEEPKVHCWQTSDTLVVRIKGSDSLRKETPGTIWYRLYTRLSVLWFKHTILNI